MLHGHIPSQPQEKHLFGLENYEKITSRICKIEGDYYFFSYVGLTILVLLAWFPLYPFHNFLFRLKINDWYGSHWIQSSLLQSKSKRLKDNVKNKMNLLIYSSGVTSGYRSVCRWQQSTCNEPGVPFLFLLLRSTVLIRFMNAMRIWTACVTRLEMQHKLRPKVKHRKRHCILFLLNLTLQSLTSFWMDIKYILFKHAISFLLGCTKKAVDVVFLIDGSSSLTKNNFQQNKDIVMDIMNTLANKSTKVWLLLN